MKILAIDTSCDETAAAATNNNQVLSNIIWSQASAHAKFGGVMPSLAKRMHEERINWVISEAIKRSQFLAQNLDAIAVTCGPGLAIALEVGIIKAKEIARKYRVPLIPVNHIEAHLLSPLTQPRSRSFASKNLKLPAYGLCISG